MHTCERCGTRFGRVTPSESCPRCLARDGVRVPLAFPGSGEEGASGRSRPGALEAAVRRQLTRTAQGRRPGSGAGLRDAA